MRTSLRQCKILEGGEIYVEMALESPEECGFGRVAIDLRCQNWGGDRLRMDTLHDYCVFLPRYHKSDFNKKQCDELAVEIESAGDFVPSPQEVTNVYGSSFPGSLAFKIQRGDIIIYT